MLPHLGEGDSGPPMLVLWQLLCKDFQVIFGRCYWPVSRGRHRHLNSSARNAEKIGLTASWLFDTDKREFRTAMGAPFDIVFSAHHAIPEISQMVIENCQLAK